MLIVFNNNGFQKCELGTGKSESHFSHFFNQNRNALKHHLLIFVLMICLSQWGSAQDVSKQVSCLDSSLKIKVDSIKQEMASRGFIVLKEASLTMESGYEMPIFVPLSEGTWYDFAFIGDKSSNLYEVRMYDHNQKEVVYEKHSGNGVQSNLINFSYTPMLTEYHVIKTVQLNSLKKKQICGYVIMFKKVK